MQNEKRRFININWSVIAGDCFCEKRGSFQLDLLWSDHKQEVVVEFILDEIRRILHFELGMSDEAKRRSSIDNRHSPSCYVQVAQSMLQAQRAGKEIDEELNEIRGMVDIFLDNKCSMCMRQVNLDLRYGDVDNKILIELFIQNIEDVLKIRRKV